jgi:hypothetical protein
VSRTIVLDASAFDSWEAAGEERLRALLGISDGGDLRCAALTLAEVCRSRALTKRAESMLGRLRGTHRIRIVPTDEGLAKRVGQLLADAPRGSCHLADAHVVALCADADRALVITSDPDDINHLAASLRGVRIVTRQP